MWKKVLAFMLSLVLCVSAMWFANPLTPTLKASADTYRYGFYIVPEKEDETGVQLDSGFLLSSQTEISLDYVKQNVSIRGGVAFTITPASGGKYLLKPANELKQNKVYFIDINTPDGNTVSFAFQTRRDFTVLGSLPTNMSAYVPLDTGIELYFSYPDVKDISKHFEISPKVNGRFETNGYTAVFIPKELKAGTLYTVTVKKGLTAANGAVSLAQDYIFSFETSPDEKSTADPYKGNLYINRDWFEFGTAEIPAIPFDLYMRERLNSAEVTLSLYRFKSPDDFVKAVREKEKVPTWAPFTLSKSRIDTSGLNKVLEFKQTFDLQKWGTKYMFFPESQSHGYYLVELTCDELSAQTFLQISDVSGYTISDKDETLFWLNDLLTGSPVKDAKIYDYISKKSYLTDESGLAKIPASKKTGNGENMTQDLFRVTTSDGKISLINAGYSYDYGIPYRDYSTSGLYWRYIQTDRTLYKPSDIVEFWGYVKSRVDSTTPQEVTVELASGGYYFPMRSIIMGSFLPFLSNPLETFKLKTQNGFYEGSVKLPALEPGSYTITIKDGEEVLSSTYFRVENYIKPQYTLEITSDKKAVFVDEEITFTIKASFFDGTPVANVPLNYSINTYTESINDSGVTGLDGTLRVKYAPKYEESMQGVCYFGISANAQFPETGDVSEYYNFKVFANDICCTYQGEIKDGKGIVDITANKVDLTTLNDDDPANDDYAGIPVSSQKFNAGIVHVTWEKIEIGDEYDPINKVVRKVYEYREKRTPAGSASIVTGPDGKAHYEFAVNKYDEGHYIVEISTQDTKGRSMKNNIWLYGSIIGYPGDYEYYYLKTDKEKYKAGETVNVQVQNNKEQPLTGKRTLFVEARNGIQGFKVNSEPKLSQPFPEAYAPNYYLEGIVFTGKAYIQTNCVVVYDYDEKNLTLEIKTDKPAYKPGENMTIDVKATDRNGKPVEAMVNISLVDEALLKLSGHQINPLAELYSWIGSGITRTGTNRDEALARGSDIYGGVLNGAVTQERAEQAKAQAAPMPSSAPAADEQAGSSAQVRSEFKDTALFKTLALSPEGTGTFTFKLPDNITSFSLAAAAVSSDLHAGSKIQSAKVSMPFFINDALSLDYLAGDRPYAGVAAYGEGLRENESVTFEITIKELPDYKETASAIAFERINIPLPEMQEGIYTLVMAAKSGTGLADAISRTITVYPSYRTIETASLKELVPGTELDAGKSGITTLVFADAGRGSLINSLHQLAWDCGKRLDQKLVAYHARKLLEELLDNENYYLDEIDVDPSSYKNEDGGYGILPYAASDISFTALITPLMQDLVDVNTLKMYLYNAVLSQDKIQAAALFALAELGEPVLLDLNRAGQVQNLTLEDTIYLGMAYAALGDLSKANEIYERRVSPSLEHKEPYVRVKIKGSDTDASYRQTALAAAYASRINHNDASGLYAYIENSYSKTQYIGVERILYLSDMMNKLPDVEASFEYTYDGKTNTADLRYGRCEVIKVPSINIGKFKVSKVTGNVSVLSLYMSDYTEEARNETGVTMTRRYYNAATGKETNTFAANDLVKVEISYNIDKTAIDNTYEISDYAPAGLKPLNSPWNYGIRDLMYCWYRQFDGQKVTFVVGKSKEPPKPLVYYARVASPGQYIAEGTVAQGSLVKSSIRTLEDARIIIKP